MNHHLATSCLSSKKLHLYRVVHKSSRCSFFGVKKTSGSNKHRSKTDGQLFQYLCFVQLNMRRAFFQPITFQTGLVSTNQVSGFSATSIHVLQECDLYRSGFSIFYSGPINSVEYVVLTSVMFSS
jgi:hypothetical protein